MTILIISLHISLRLRSGRLHTGSQTGIVNEFVVLLIVLHAPPMSSFFNFVIIMVVNKAYRHVIFSSPQSQPLLKFHILFSIFWQSSSINVATYSEDQITQQRAYGHSAAGRITMVKNSNGAIRNRTRDLPTLAHWPLGCREHLITKKLHNGFIYSRSQDYTL
jgi:hypothetical protein